MQFEQGPTRANAEKKSAPELLWTGRSKKMALTCNVETVFREFLNPGVWPVDPNRLGSRLNPPKLLARQCATRRRLELPAGPEQRTLSRYFRRRVPGYFLGISRYV